jgi:transcriptional regulator with XRE-family HTH domain
MSEVKMVVARNIRKLRKDAKMTQKQLADRLAVGESVISNWEMGRNSPDIVQVFLMCRLFGVMPSVMMGLESESDHQQAYRQAPPEVQQAVDTLLKQHQR